MLYVRQFIVLSIYKQPHYKFQVVINVKVRHGY
jgi:hypothetical protein